MADQQQSLRLFHASNSVCGVMVRGNIALTTGKPKEAIEHYTEVLYKLSPGHVCAFLNRSMAYLEEGYYELAAMDAHRARIATDELRKTSPVPNQRLGQVVRYINAERMHVGANDDWTKEAHRNIGKGWAKSPLASILITATPDIRVPTFGTNTNSLARALEIRATYRLCGALFMVGEGARKDAVDLIEGMKFSMQEKSWESFWFTKLSNEIFDQFVSEVDHNNSIATRVAGSDTRANRDERMKTLTENMKTTTTHYCYGDYPWNTNEPEFGGTYWETQVQDWLENFENFSAVIVDPQGMEDTQTKAQKPHVELRAARDFKSGEYVLDDEGISNVTTFIQEPIKEDEGIQANGLWLSYCTGCASLLAVPWKSALNMQKSQATKRPKYVVPVCGLTCRQLKLDLNIGSSPTNIEQELCKEHLDNPNSRLMTDRKTLCLRDLIFLRHVAMAMRRGKSPLDLPELMFATCGPHTRDISQITQVDPWSYTSHVVRPLAYLDKHLACTHTDQFANLSKLDGWIIHALLSKISRGMRVSKGPQYAQVFHKDGKRKIVLGPGHPHWEDLTKLPDNKDDDDSIPWVAGIDTLFNLIRIADPAKGESPNVVVVQKRRLYVYAVQPDDGGRAIKAGEPLLRAKDEEGNQALLGERIYSEQDMDPDCLAVTDDEEEEKVEGDVGDEDNEDGDGDDDASGEHSGDTSDFLEESSAEEGEDKDENEGEGQAVPPADPRAGDWFSSWSWRGGRLQMG